jgi:Na+-translocating ferredoxin:NAD+ oxidoreductase subunit A
MSDLLLVVIGTVLVNHFVLARSEAEAGEATAVDFNLGLDLAVLSGGAFLLATAILLPLDRYVLIPFNLTYVRLLALAGVCAIATRLIRVIGPRPGRPPGHIVDVTLPAANSALLVIALQQVALNRSGFELLAIAVALAAGFGLLLLAFTELLKRIDHPAVPDLCRGAPLTLITAGLAALALLGLA